MRQNRPQVGEYRIHRVPAWVPTAHRANVPPSTIADATVETGIHDRPPRDPIEPMDRSKDGKRRILSVEGLIRHPWNQDIVGKRPNQT